VGVVPTIPLLLLFNSFNGLEQGLSLILRGETICSFARSSTRLSVYFPMYFRLPFPIRFLLLVPHGILISN
jgi:hypothetical protein